MNEAERCDRISLMHAGKVLVSDTPAAIVEKRGSKNLEDAFISYLEDAAAGDESAEAGVAAAAPATETKAEPASPFSRNFSRTRVQRFSPRAALELGGEPNRATRALLWTGLLYFRMR